MDTAADNKPWYASKTFWASVLTAVAPLVPPVRLFAAANPELYSAVLGAVFGALRITTTAPLTLRKPKVLP